MESNYPVITNVFDTDWCNHLWGDTHPGSARDKGVTMEPQHVHLQQGDSEPGYVSFKNEPEHRDLLMQEVHIPSEMPVVGHSSVYPLRPGGLQNSSKNAVNQHDLQGLHFHVSSDSRKSRARFTREEERALLAGVVERWDELYGHQSQALPRGAKARVWSDIAARLSGPSREAREGEDVRKKWLYIKLTLRNRLRAPCPPDLSPLEQRVLALMGHDRGGSVDAPDIGFGPVSGEEFRPLALQGPEDLETVGSTSDPETDGNQVEPQEEPVPPPFLTAPVSVPSPRPVPTTPSTSAPTSASSAQRKNTRVEDPLAPALWAIRSRQDRSISLYQEAIGALRTLAADVRRYVDHMLAVTVPQQQPPAHTPPPPTPTPGPAPSPPRGPTPTAQPPGRQPPSVTPATVIPSCAAPSCAHAQSAVPLSQTVPPPPACSFPPQCPHLCPYHIMPHFPPVVYPAYYTSPPPSMYQLPQHTPPAAAPHIYQHPPAVTVVAPPPFYLTPSPVAPPAAGRRSPPPSFCPAPPPAPADPAQPAASCAPFSDCLSGPHSRGPPPPASSPPPHQSATLKRRGRGWVRKRWGRRGGSSYLLGRSGGFG